MGLNPRHLGYRGCAPTIWPKGYHTTCHILAFSAAPMNQGSMGSSYVWQPVRMPCTCPITRESGVRTRPHPLLLSTYVCLQRLKAFHVHYWYTSTVKKKGKKIRLCYFTMWKRAVIINFTNRLRFHLEPISFFSCYLYLLSGKDLRLVYAGEKVVHLHKTELDNLQ